MYKDNNVDREDKEIIMYTTGERWNEGDNKLVDEKIVGMSTGHLPGLIRSKGTFKGLGNSPIFEA